MLANPKINPNVRDTKRTPAIILAAAHGQTQSIKLMLANPTTKIWCTGIQIFNFGLNFRICVFECKPISVLKGHTHTHTHTHTNPDCIQCLKIDTLLCAK